MFKWESVKRRSVKAKGQFVALHLTLMGSIYGYIWLFLVFYSFKGRNWNQQLDQFKESLIEKLFIIIAGLAQFLFQNNIFICPQTGYKEYANLILFTPMLTLFLLSMMVTSKFSNLLKLRKVQCICSGSSKKNKLLFKVSDADDDERRKQNYCLCKQSVISFLHSFAFFLIPSMTWIVFCLLRKEIYVCSKVGLHFYNASGGEAKLILNGHRAESMKIGFILLQTFAAILILLTLLKRCFTGKITQHHSIYGTYRHFSGTFVSLFSVRLLRVRDRRWDSEENRGQLCKFQWLSVLT